MRRPERKQFQRMPPRLAMTRPASMKNDRGWRRDRFRERGARRELAGASDRSETASNEALGIENKPDAVRIYARRSSLVALEQRSLDVTKV